MARKTSIPQDRRQSKRLKAAGAENSIPTIVKATMQTIEVSVPHELGWITANLGERDPLLVFHFIPAAVNALRTELQAVFPAAAPQIFLTHPFTDTSVQDDILRYMANIDPAAALNHSHVHGCMIGPNDGPEYSRVLGRIGSFQEEASQLGLNAAHLQFPVASPYAIFEGRASVLLEGVNVGSGVAGVFIA